jgi:hypothetical protein
MIATTFREAMARSLFAVLRPLNLFGGQPTASSVAVPQRRMPPTILIPGLDVGRASMIGLSIFLKRRGWPWVWAVGRGGREASLAEESEALGEQVATLMRAANAEEVDLVAFGTGGLLAAWFLKHRQGAPIRRLVTIGTPWKGTRIAVFQRGRAARDVLPGSHVLDGLVPSRTPTTCIWSPDDPIVVPTDSAIPDHGVQSVCIVGAGHLEMLLSARVFRAVQAALEQPLPSADTPLPSVSEVPSPAPPPSLPDEANP